jgi:hypothetical protein
MLLYLSIINLNHTILKKTILILALLITFSCADENVTKTNQVNNKQQNTLKFKDGTTMLAYFDDVNLRKESSNGRSANIKFESFDKIYKNVLDQLNQAKSIVDHDSILKVYSDVILLSDSSYSPRLNNALYRTICNRDRLYESGGFIHKVIDDNFIVYTKLQNENGIRQITSLNNLDTAIFKVRKYQDSNLVGSNGRVSTDCSNSVQAEYFDNRRKCRDDRTVTIRAYTSYAISGNTYTGLAISEVNGRIRNWLCNWNLYETVLSTRNCSFDIRVKINNIDTIVPFAFADQSPPEERYEIILREGSFTDPIVWAGGVQPSVTFTRVRLEATSRGVNGGWAIVNCP